MEELDLDAYELVWEGKPGHSRIDSMNAFNKVTGLNYQKYINLGNLVLGTHSADFYLIEPWVFCMSFPSDSIYKRIKPKRVRLNA
jgi:hypothetical protein